MKIISFVAIKGGVGKTTLCFNYGEWLAKKGYNVLLIDSDHQCSLSQTYEIYREEGTIAEVFTTLDSPEIIKVRDNLSIIPGSMKLDLINNEIQTKANKELLLYMWFADNYDNLLSKYDYVLIDCHPDFSTITQNMIAISDYVFSPIEPSEYSFTAKENLEIRMKTLESEVINVQTRESFINAELKYIGNRIKHNTASSKEFVEVMQKDENTLAMIPEREIFNKTTLNHIPISSLVKKDLTESNRKLITLLDETFDKFTNL